jgi:hypothetical protein
LPFSDDLQAIDKGPETANSCHSSTFGERRV